MASERPRESDRSGAGGTGRRHRGPLAGLARRAGIAAGLAGVAGLAGCLGGGGDGGSGDGGGTTTPSAPDVFGDLSWEDGNVFVELPDEDAVDGTVGTVVMVDPLGRQVGTDSPNDNERTAGIGFPAAYPPGRHVVYGYEAGASRGDEPLAASTYDIRPSVEMVGLEQQSGIGTHTVGVFTIENTGNGPLKVTRADLGEPEGKVSPGWGGESRLDPGETIGFDQPTYIGGWVDSEQRREEIQTERCQGETVTRNLYVWQHRTAERIAVDITAAGGVGLNGNRGPDQWECEEMRLAGDDGDGGE